MCVLPWIRWCAVCVCGSVCSLMLSYLPVYPLIPSSSPQACSVSFVLGFYVLGWLSPVLKRDRHRWFVGASLVVYPLASCLPYQSCFTPSLAYVVYMFCRIRLCFRVRLCFLRFFSFTSSVCTALLAHLVELGSLALLSLF